METETWKVIPNFTNYEASNFGRLRSLNYKKTGRIQVLKPAISGGYLKTMLLGDDKKYKSWTVHKFVALTWLGEPKTGLEVNHIDGNKLNNNISNLEYITRAQNIQHAFDLGLAKGQKGSLNGNSKLKEFEVIEIREHAKNNGKYYGRKALAEKYGVSECTIKEVVSRRKNKFSNV